MSKSLVICDMTFERKKDLEIFLKEMLNRYDLGDKVSSQDQAFLTGVLQRHPDATLKIGCGIESFSVRSADYGTRCFWVNRLDKSTEKFSFRSCIYK